MTSSYPAGLDTLATDKADATTAPTDHPGHHNDMADAINKIEAELGTDPSSSYSTVAARLAALGSAVGAVPVTQYGAVGIGAGTTTGTINASSTSLAITAGQNDYVNGQYILVRGAGVAGADSTAPDLWTYIVSGQGTSTLVLHDAAGTSVVNAKVFHDDTKVIQDCVTANRVVVFPPVTGGYGMSAQLNTQIALKVPANTTLIGYGYPSRLVRNDTYKWGDTVGTTRFLTDTNGGSNFVFTGLYIDGNLAEALAAWPTTTVGTTYTSGTSLLVTSGATFPASGDVVVLMDDGTYVRRSYTKSTNTLTIASGLGGTATAGNAVEAAINTQGYQCFLFDGSSGSKIYNFTIDNCWINGWPGTTIRPKNVENFRISNNHLIDVHRGPLEITDGCAYGMISGNVVDGSFDDGLDVNGNTGADTPAHHLNFIGNIVRQTDPADSDGKGRTGNTCMKISGAHHVNVIGNLLEGGENTAALMIWDSDSNAPFVPVEDVVVANNELYNSSTHGIRIRSAAGSRVKVIGNSIYLPAFSGIMIEPQTPDTLGPGNVLSDIVISNNDIYDAGGGTSLFGTDLTHGIVIGNSTTANTINRLEVLNNKIVRPRTAGIFCKTSGNDWHFDGNRIYDPNWAGSAANTAAINLNAGTVVRFSVRDNHIVAANTNLGANKPKYGVQIANTWSEGYLRGTIAYTAHFITAATSDSSTGTTTIASSDKTS